MIEFTPEVLKNLKAEYNKAVESGQEIFIFQGNELLTDYAKYLIQYVESQFEARCACLN